MNRWYTVVFLVFAVLLLGLGSMALFEGPFPFKITFFSVMVIIAVALVVEAFTKD